MRLSVAVNPMAAFGRHGAVGELVVARLEQAGHEVTPLQEASFAELRDRAAQALSAGTDGLIVVGGDGMVSLGVNLLAQAEIPLGMVAAGTGNDFARGLGLPYAHPEAALAALIEQLSHPPRRVDLARVSAPGVERWVAGICSAGFDALVNERANRMLRPRGPRRYVLAMLAELARLRSRHYRLEIDGETREVDAVLIAVGNSTSIGGGMRLTPTALLDDGELDVLIGHSVSRLGLLALFPKVYSGTHQGHPAVEMFRAKRVRIEAADITAFADGEPIAPLPVDIEVVPGALSVWAAHAGLPLQS